MKIPAEYLNTIQTSLKLNCILKDSFVRELHTHIEDKAQELQKFGFSEREAVENAARSLGSPRLIARQIYEVYSQGSWNEALFAALPHFFMALLFALQWWENTFWMPVVLLLIIAIVMYGWFHDQPMWLFPWMGYCLVPVTMAGILLIYLPGSWAWIAFLPYVVLALLLLGYVGKQMIKKDWLMVSLTLMPVPIVAGWLLSICLRSGDLRLDMLYETAPAVSLSFVILSLAVLLFVRIRQRWMKTSALLVPEIALLSVISFISEGIVSFGWWLALVLLSVIILISPAIIDRRLK